LGGADDRRLGGTGDFRVKQMDAGEKQHPRPEVGSVRIAPQ